MNNPSMVLYLGSRIIAAAGNLASVAVFTRFIGPEEYGAYILVFAWAIIVYGFATQWMKFAYFGVYRAVRAGEIVASYTRLALAVTAVVGTAVLIAGALVPSGLAFAAALAALFAGMTIYEGTLEISRTRLQVGTVALCMVLRAAFVLAFGTLALSVWPSAVALALAVAAGHLLAAVPSLVMLRGFAGARPAREAAAGLVRYGWPLIFSFGVLALGQTIDRLTIAYFAGNAVLGPYGVVADLMRQSFLVVGESIALALVTVAKQHADEGRREASDATLRLAFRACLVAGAFGAAFFIVFGHDLVRLLLGEGFAQPAYEIIPWFALAFCFMTLRSFYFAQVIYFTNATVLELAAAAVLVAVSALLALALVPRMGAAGGAVALMIAHGGACLVAALAGRRFYVLPVDPAALAGIPLLAAVAVGGAWALATILGGPALWMAQGALFAVAAGFAIWSFGLFSLVGLGAGRRTGAP